MIFKNYNRLDTDYFSHGTIVSSGGSNPVIVNDLDSSDYSFFLFKLF